MPESMLNCDYLSNMPYFIPPTPSSTGYVPDCNLLVAQILTLTWRFCYYLDATLELRRLEGKYWLLLPLHNAINLSKKRLLLLCNPSGNRLQPSSTGYLELAMLRSIRGGWSRVDYRAGYTSLPETRKIHYKTLEQNCETHTSFRRHSLRSRPQYTFANVKIWHRSFCLYHWSECSLVMIDDDDNRSMFALNGNFWQIASNGDNAFLWKHIIVSFAKWSRLFWYHLTQQSSTVSHLCSCREDYCVVIALLQRRIHDCSL